MKLLNKYIFFYFIGSKRKKVLKYYVKINTKRLIKEKIPKNLVSISAGFDKNIQQIEALLQRSDKVFDDNSTDIRQSVVSLREALTVVTKNIDNIVYNLNTASRNLSEFSYQIRANPAVLLGSNPPADIAEGK